MAQNTSNLHRSSPRSLRALLVASGGVICTVVAIACFSSCRGGDHDLIFRSTQAEKIQYYQQHYSGSRKDYTYIKQARADMEAILASPVTEQDKALLAMDLEDMLVDGPHFNSGQLIMLNMTYGFLVEHSSKRAQYLKKLALKVDRALTEQPHDQGVITSCVGCIEMLEDLADVGIIVNKRDFNVNMKQWAMLRDAILQKASGRSEQGVPAQPNVPGSEAPKKDDAK